MSGCLFWSKIFRPDVAKSCPAAHPTNAGTSANLGAMATSIRCGMEIAMYYYMRRDSGAQRPADFGLAGEAAWSAVRCVCLVPRFATSGSGCFLGGVQARQARSQERRPADCGRRVSGGGRCPRVSQRDLRWRSRALRCPIPLARGALCGALSVRWHAVSCSLLARTCRCNGCRRRCRFSVLTLSAVGGRDLRLER